MTIRDQYTAAFVGISAYAILRGSAVVAKVAIKRSRTGTRTTAFVHWIGAGMVKAVANGGGYDKDSASVARAACLITDPGYMTANDGPAYGNWQAFIKAASLDGGKRWDDAVRDAGFTVIQAV